MITRLGFTLAQNMVGTLTALNLRQLGGLCQMRVSIGGNQGGVEKKTPIDPMPMGGQTGGMNKAVTMLTHGLTNANPMPRKKDPHLNWPLMGVQTSGRVGEHHAHHTD